MIRTSRPKNPNTGQAPISRKASPAIKLTTLKKPISTRKPVRFNDLCGVSSAENSFGCDSGSSKSLPAVMACQYIPIMSKITRRPSSRPKTTAKKSARMPAKKSVKKSSDRAAANPRSNKSAKTAATKVRRASTPKALADPSAKPWSPAEVHEAFSRFSKANPEPRGELEHLNPYTLLVAVVLSAQATDAGVNKATRSLFEVADTPQKMLALGEERVRDYIRTIGLYRNTGKNVIALSEKPVHD